MKVSVRDETTREVEVELPLYRAQYLDRSTIYMRIDEIAPGQLREVSITIEDHKSSCQIEIDDHYRFDPRSAETYQLGEQPYACTPEEFQDATRIAKSILEQI